MYNKIKNILVIKLRYLGDVVVTTPVFKELRYHYPKAFIAALVNKGTEAMLTQNPDIDKLLVLERYKNPVLNFIKQIGLINILRELHFDLVLELTANDRGAFLGFMSGAKRRVGFKPAKMKKLDRHLLFTDLITPNEKEHIIEHHLRMIKYLGYIPLRKDLALYWSKEDETDCNQVLRKKGLSLNDHFVVLHPILQARFRAWRIEGYAAICDYLQKKYSRNCKIVGKEGNLEWDFNENIVWLHSKNGSKKLFSLNKYDYNNMYIDEVKYFFDCINKKKKVANDIKIAARILKYCVAK